MTYVLISVWYVCVELNLHWIDSETQVSKEVSIFIAGARIMKTSQWHRAVENRCVFSACLKALWWQTVPCGLSVDCETLLSSCSPGAWNWVVATSDVNVTAFISCSCESHQPG